LQPLIAVITDDAAMSVRSWLFFRKDYKTGAFRVKTSKAFAEDGTLVMLFLVEGCYTCYTSEYSTDVGDAWCWVSLRA
jgi:hypothetical protein